MYDLRLRPPGVKDVSSNWSKIAGMTVVVVGLGVLGAYAFASNRSPKIETQAAATTFVRTTPEYAEIMPPPVSAPAANNGPLKPQPAKPQEARRKVPSDTTPPAVLAERPIAAPSSLRTPPENAPPQQDHQDKSTSSDQKAPGQPQ